MSTRIKMLIFVVCLNAIKFCMAEISAGDTYYMETVGDYTWAYKSIGRYAVEIYYPGREISSEPSGHLDIPSATLKEIPPVTVEGRPSTVTGIGPSAFSGCRGLTSVTIPNSVESIGDYAFYDCNGLTSVTMPYSVRSIGYQAFYRCIGLTNVSIPGSVTSIGDYAFYCCSGLMSFTVSSGNANYSAVNGLLLSKDGKTLVAVPGGLTSVAIPDSVTSIGDCAFSGCSGLTSIMIPSSVTRIGNGAFFDCSGLVSVAIPDSVTSIGDNAFSWCSSLTSVTVGDGVKNIGEGAFYPCSNLTNATIGSSVTNIGNYAFQRCTSLISVTMPNSIKSIGDGAFNLCRNLTNISIPNSIKSIGYGAFSRCRSLTNISIPNSVKSIGERAFSDCSGLASVTIPVGTISIGDRAFEFCTNVTSLTAAYVPDGIDKSKLTNVTIQDGVKSIGKGVFDDCSGLTSVTIPNSVTNISKYAFPSSSLMAFMVSDGNAHYSSANGLLLSKDGKSLIIGINGDVTIPDGVTNIVDVAFSGCSGLMSFTVSNSNVNYSSVNGLLLSKDGRSLICGVNGNVTIPDGVTNIVDRAFFGRSGLTSVTIPDSVTSIGEYAFYGCSGLTNVTIPDSVTSIGSGAFDWCDGLTSVTIPQYVCSKWRPLGFEKCITNIVFSESVTNIGDGAFYGFSGLTSVTIPDSVTNIGDRAFRDCIRLTSVTIPSGVTSIGDEAFRDCSRLTSVTIPDGVTSIGEYAFSGCSGLMSVAILSDAYVRNAFSDCTNVTSLIASYVPLGIDRSKLMSVTIPYGTAYIRTQAFYDCSGLVSVVIPDSVTNINGYAFSGCLNLAKLYFEGNSPTVSKSAFMYRVADGCTAYVTSDSTGWGVDVPGIWNGINIAHGVSTYKIKFNMSGGESRSDKTVAYGVWESIAPPTRDGYAFAGWKVSGHNIGTAKYSAQSGIDVAMTASQVIVPSTGSVSFKNLNTGVVGDNCTTLTAQWVSTYTIKFNLTGGGTRADETVAYGAWASITPPTKANYIFTGWKVSGHNIGTAMYSLQNGIEMAMKTRPIIVYTTGNVSFKNLNTGIDGDTITTLMAQWKLRAYTIKFDMNGGETRTDETVVYGTWKSIAPPTRAGYTFYGWVVRGHNKGTAMYSVRDGVEVAISTSSPVTIVSNGNVSFKDLNTGIDGDDCTTLIAQWTPHAYTIKFDMNGGDSRAFGNASCGSWKTVTPPLSRTGYTFVGWKAIEHNTETAMYSVQNGVEVAMATNPVTILATGNVSFKDLNTGVDGDDCTTLIAQWTPHTYTIKFNLNGGGIRADETVAYGTWTSILPPTRVGYTFTGWLASGHNRGTAMYSVQSGVDMMMSTNTVMVSTIDNASFRNLNAGVDGDTNTTLAAQWTANDYIIRYLANGGSGKTFQTLATYDAEVSILANGFTRANHEFLGWSTSPFGNVVYSTGDVVSNLTDKVNGVVGLYAVWRLMELQLPLNEVLGVDDAVQITTGDNVVWAPVEDSTTDTGRSVRSGNIGNHAETWLQALVAGVGTLSFSNKVSCRHDDSGICNYDCLMVYVDGQERADWRIDGQTGWVSRSVEFATDGVHTIRWVYHKDSSYVYGDGDDCAWVSGLTWDLPPDPIPVIRTDDDVAEALEGAADTNLSVNLTNKNEYNAFRAWVERRGINHQTVKEASKAWLSYALDANAPIGKKLKTSDLNVRSFTPHSVGNFAFEIAVNGIDIGDNATADNLAKVFGIEGANTLDGMFSSDNVSVSFGAPQDGKASVMAGPKDTTESFFMRATMTDFYGDIPVVSFSLNGGGSLNGSLNEKLVDCDSEYGDMPTPTRTGYSFAGWFTKVTGGTKVTGSTTITTNGAHTLYAHWSANTYSVTFNPNGGSVSPTSKTVTYGSTYGTLPTPTRNGYIFAGWHTAAVGGMMVTDATSVETDSAHTLYAHWDEPISYTATFNPNGGSVSTTSKTVTYGATYGTLPSPTRTGYTFAGWYTASSGGSKVISTTSVTSSTAHTLYAHWTARTYTVTFNPNGGSVSQTSKTVTYSAAYGDMPTPTRTGYTFAGWHTSSSGGTKVSDTTSVTTASAHTLYAHWTAKKYTVTFNPNGGRVSPTSKTVTYRSTYGTLPTPTRAGYSFDGWYTASSDGTKVTDTTSVSTASAHTLYAHWSEESGVATSLYCIIDISSGYNSSSYPVTYMDVAPEGGFAQDEFKTTKIVLRRISPGTFKLHNETTTSISAPYYIGLFEVTQRQYELVMGTNPATGTSVGNKYPVYNVSYDNIRGSSKGAQWPTSKEVDATSFMGRLRTKTSLDFDLPTEAQWEYACRAGTTTAYYWGDSMNGGYAWYISNSGSTAHEVGLKGANAWGLYDMVGNLQEWCADWYSSTTYPRRFVRGGGYSSGAADCKYDSYCIYGVPPSSSNTTTGFRIAL